jgi:hypothetical protein
MRSCQSDQGVVQERFILEDVVFFIVGIAPCLGCIYGQPSFVIPLWKGGDFA